MLKNYNDKLIEYKDHLVVAVSGGIDSMVILDYLIQQKERLSLTLSVAHIDHHKRLNSSKDADFVRQYAIQHHLDFYLYQLENDYEENFHDYAHKKRYDFFVDVANQCKANKVVLAHHLDDLAETVIMRLIRGSSFEGYMGIPETSIYKNTLMIRPILYVSRESIQTYQKHYNIPYRNDESNEEDDYTRNRFRHHLMPLLKEENPKYLDKLKQFSLYQANAYRLIEKETDNYLSNILFDKEVINLNIHLFKDQLEIIQIESLKRMINHLTRNQLELSYQNISDIIDIILSNKAHIEYHIGDHLHIYKSYDNIRIQNHNNETDDFECIINDLGHFTIDGRIDVFVAKKANKSYDYIYKLCYNNLDLTFPLILRNRRPGDRLDIKIGTKKLKDFFIDKKVPMAQRNQLPLIANQKNEILFIPALFSKKQPGNDSIYIHMNIQ